MCKDVQSHEMMREEEMTKVSIGQARRRKRKGGSILRRELELMELVKLGWVVVTM